MELLYFARIRENIGHGSESLPLPENVSDVNSLINHLCTLGANYDAAFENDAALRVAVNQIYVDFDHPVLDGDEVAFFPPMTGG